MRLLLMKTQTGRWKHWRVGMGTPGQSRPHLEASLHPDVIPEDEEQGEWLRDLALLPAPPTPQDCWK